jgi:transcriptional regulator with XRE-family HTH domain
MIYFVRCSSTGLVKIGFANDPWARLSKIRSDSPGELTLLGIEEGGVDREAELHAEFASCRERGEWFRPDDRLSKRLAALSPPERPRRRKPLGGALGRWLMEHDLGIADFGKRVGVTHSTISRICSGTKMPSPALMERIAVATDGAVQPNDWFDLEAAA